jgi:hypothetical protein
MSFISTETVIYIYDRYGSNTPFLEFIKLNLTISLVDQVLFPVIGSLIHYLKIVAYPLGVIL